MQYFLRRVPLVGLFFAIFIFSFKTSTALQAVVKWSVFYAPVAGDTTNLTPYLEVYWQIDPQTLLFAKKDGLVGGKVRTDLVLTAADGKTTEEHYFLETPRVGSSAEALSLKLIDLRRLALSPGSYKLSLSLTDTYMLQKPFVFKDSFVVEKPEMAPMFSSIQLVDTSIESSEENIFQRHGRVQIPLTVDFLDDQRRTLQYYAELYRVSSADTAVGPFSVRVYISKKPNEGPMHQLQVTDTVEPSWMHIMRGRFSTATLPSGNYYLIMVLQDRYRTELARQSLFFQLMNPNPETFSATVNKDTTGESQGPVYLDIAKTFVGKYDAAQIRAILKMLVPIATAAENSRISEFLKTPDEIYSRFFIYNFWLSRSVTNPERAWNTYAEQVKLVNKNFGSSLLRGYETDRGQIYLKYGAPKDRITVQNESGALPYEIWQYESLPHQGAGMFLFYRPGFVANDYKLLHSTVNGEIRNRSWRISLYPNGMSPNPESSRAEQYFGNL